MARSKAIPPVPVVDSDLDIPPPARGDNISGERLRSFIERIERLLEERQSLSDDIKEIKSEAKATGFEVKIINFLIRERKQDVDDLDEFNTLVDVYRRALKTEEL